MRAVASQDTECGRETGYYKTTLTDSYKIVRIFS